MKKFILVALFFGTLLFGGSALASTPDVPDYTDILETDYNHVWFIKKYYDNYELMLVKKSDAENIKLHYNSSSNGFVPETSFYYKRFYWESSGGVYAWRGGRSTVNASAGQVMSDFKLNSGELLYSSTDIYTDNSYSDVFFSKTLPPKPIAERGNPEKIPETMVKTLVDGGLLSQALIIFAILLGVGLVARYLFSLTRLYR